MLRLFALIGVLLLLAVPRLPQADPSAAQPPTAAAVAAPAAVVTPPPSQPKGPAAPATIVRLPAPAGSPTWGQTPAAIEAALRQLQAQLQGVEDRLDTVLEAVTALGTRLDALETASPQRSARAADPEQLEAIARAIEALGARLQALETALRPFTTRRAAEPPQAERAADGPIPPPPLADPPGVPATVYVVQPGDTLRALAGRFAVEPQRLIELNRLEAPDRLLAGQRLRIPQGAQPALAP